MVILFALSGAATPAESVEPSPQEVEIIRLKAEVTRLKAKVRQLQKQVADLSAPTLAEYRVSLDYGWSIEGLIKAGDYKLPRMNVGGALWHAKFQAYLPFSSRDYRKSARRSGVAGVTLEVLDMEVTPSFDIQEMRTKIGRMGFRAATLKELLVLGKTYPGAQRKRCLIAFGSYRSDAHTVRVPHLYGGPYERKVDDFVFGRTCYPVVVRLEETP